MSEQSLYAELEKRVSELEKRMDRQEQNYLAGDSQTKQGTENSKSRNPMPKPAVARVNKYR